MTNVSPSKFIARLVVIGSLCCAVNLAAQDAPSNPPSAAAAPAALPEGARVNKDKCLGYEMDYKKYPKPVIAKVQADMYQLYHQDADWQHDAALKGKPLNDGILGPITWSWMQRFCKNFALDIDANVVSTFPGRAGEVAKFSQGFNDAAATLTSKPFMQWSVSHHRACNLDVQKTLAHGSDEQLLALVRCYLEGEAKPVKHEKVVIKKPIEAHRLYVLREDDFVTMAEASASAKAIAKAIETFQGKEYPSKAAAQTEANNLLKDVPEQESKAILTALMGQLEEQNRYVITDQVLNTLNQQGISDALFDALTALPEKNFADQVSFKKAVTAAINAVNHSAAPATESATTTEQPPVVTGNPTVNTERVLLQIQLLSQQEYWLAPKAAINIPVPHGPVAAQVIDLLKDLQDIEYPEGELLHSAIKNRILKAADICKQDKSNAIDKSLDKPNINEIRQYLKEAIKPAETVDKYCTEHFYDQLDAYYDGHLRQGIERVYSEPMPEYKHEPILWSGASEKCGCVPDEIQTMAYGIFPYWKTLDRPLLYDFSTFSRTAYFGLTVSDSGKLQQINSAGKNLLKDNSETFKAFIREARRYGSKLDWILEKEFAVTPELANPAALQVFYSNLHAEIINLLSTPLTDVESRLRPLLSLGLAGQPTNGDGVTLYFKNYPQTPEAKDQFDEFFKSLKEEIRELDEARNRWRVEKNITYVNIMVNKASFLGESNTFNREHLDSLTRADDWAEKNLSIVEIQDRVRTLLVLVMEDPYYTSLDEIYATTTSTDRSIIAPLMISDYAQMDTNLEHRGQSVDERKKRLAYVHESFGGGSFWPMVQYAESSDGKNYKEFNDYIGKHFSPGYTESFWNETLCAYRWPLIYTMNIWLLLAFIYLVTMFYLFPQRCKELPTLLRWLQHPLTVVAVILPPIFLWVYLLAVDSGFSLLNLSGAFCLLLLGLSIWAGVDAIKALQQQKPNRNLLHYQNRANSTAKEDAEGDSGIDEEDENSEDIYR